VALGRYPQPGPTAALKTSSVEPENDFRGRGELRTYRGDATAVLRENWNKDVVSSAVRLCLAAKSPKDEDKDERCR
jgi:hypothetical protein